MNRTAIVITVILLIPIIGAVSLAREVPPEPVVLDVGTLPAPGAQSFGKAIGDSVPLLECDFEGVLGGDWQGWTSVDLTLPPDFSRWQESTFHADNLDATPDNHAWWCGEEFVDCQDNDLTGGYGPHYDESLEWTHPADVGASSTVQVTAIANIDVEVGYDYLTLEYWSFGDWEVVYEKTGTYESESIDVEFVIPAGSYRDDDIVLRWRVRSDVGVGGLECWGAAQIDNIDVWVDGFLINTDDVQPESTRHWTPVDPATTPVGVGNFAQLMDDLPVLDVDPERINDSFQVTFINNGQLTGLAPTTCELFVVYPYGVDPWGGLLGPGNYISNIVKSPPMEWPSEVDIIPNQVLLEFDWYLHTRYSDASGEPEPNIFPAVYVRYTANDDPDQGWTGWNRVVLWHGGPELRRLSLDIKPELASDVTHLQVALGVYQISNFPISDWNNTVVTYYDNVRVTAYDRGPIYIHATPAGLAQDSFPESGALDLVDLSANGVRFDAAHNVAEPEDPNQLADWLQFTVDPFGVDPPEDVYLHYHLGPNHYYDEVRSGYPLVGAKEAWGGSDNIYACDLPDTGFLFPGDVLHYYISATEAGGGEVHTYPADLTAIADFGVTSAYPELFTFRALPAHTATGTPWVLLWNDSNRLDGFNDWPEAVIGAGLQPGDDFDVFTTTGAGYNNQNGLGTCATLALLDAYDLILYTSGNLDRRLFEEVDRNLLSSWLYRGHKNLMLSGNHLFSGLYNGTIPDAHFIAQWLGVTEAENDPLVPPYFATVEPTVEGEAAFENTEIWSVSGGAFDSPFEGLASEGFGCDHVLATYTSSNLDGSVAAHARCSPLGAMSATLVFPYDLNQVVSNGGGTDLGTMTHLVEDILSIWCQGAVPAYLQTCDVSVSAGAVEVNWRVRGEATPDEFRLEATCGENNWVVPHALGGDGMFLARDDSPNLVDGQTVTYELKMASDSSDWTVLYSEEITYKAVPRVTRLVGAHPNPFNPSTKIAFSVRRPQEVEIAVYDLSGRLVERLVRDTFPAGDHELTWDGRNAAGARASSGAYFVRMECEDLITSQKVMMLK